MSAQFDVLVVGCGSAGAVLASRLSQDPARTVAVVEAGPDYSAGPTVPHDLHNGNRMSMLAHDWGYHASILRGRSVRFPRGRVTGGSSAVGATIALRGMPSDFDEWADLGNLGWGWSEVLPYFRRLEQDLDFGATDLHGDAGPLPIRRWRHHEMPAWQHAFEESCARAGYQAVADHNDPEVAGYGAIPSNRRDNLHRVSTAQAYLQPVADRPNLHVRADCQVSRILFTGDRATGVEVIDGNGAATLAARLVVLAAGAINTPAILLRSGIGPREDLTALGIETRQDRPGVGQNLIDHPRTGIFIVPRAGTVNEDHPFLQTILRTTSTGSHTRNDMQYYMVNHFDLEPFPHLRRLSETSLITGVMVCQQRPKSRGRMRLVSADPREAPAVDLNFLSHPDDTSVLLEGIRECSRLMQHDYILANRERQLLLRDDAIDDDDIVRVYLKTTLDSSYHPVGTARMGPPDDTGAVVDHHGQVHGLENLYVADASIMPNIPSANTNLTSIMIGEKLADDLLAMA